MKLHSPAREGLHRCLQEQPQIKCTEKSTYHQPGGVPEHAVLLEMPLRVTRGWPTAGNLVDRVL
eukprot:scaffold175404_cov17-Tisochrysis_lutea.AAC.1